MQPLQVVVWASDPIIRAGITAMVQTSPDVGVVGDPSASTGADVVVIAERSVAVGTLHRLRRIRSACDGRRPRAVVVAYRFDERDTILAMHSGVMSILPAVFATEERLLDAVVGAHQGRSILPRTLQAVLLRQLDELRTAVLEPNGLTVSSFVPRERDTLRLVAEGLPTQEIAERLRCSEGTVKSTLLGLMRRLGLRNRAEAVAYAIRSGAVI